MAIDFIPRRFYTSASENSTLVSRMFVPNVNDTQLEETPFTEDAESADARSDVGSPTPLRLLDGNNNTPVTRLPLKRNGRLTSDDFVSEQKNLTTSCEHLSEMVDAEKNLEIYGFCNPRVLRGLVPERFLPSLVVFKDKCARSKNASHVLQNSLISTSSTPPDINGLLRRLAGRAGWKSKKGLDTSVQEVDGETDKGRENKIVVCSNCGCYSWAR